MRLADSLPLHRDSAWDLLLALRDCPANEHGCRFAPLTREGHAGLLLNDDGRWTARGLVPTAETVAMLDMLAPVCVPPGRQHVIGQMGQSLDGRIATASGHSHYVTGETDRERLHRVRALVDAVVVGAGTVAADDPRLTVRHVTGPNPVRVVLDRDCRLSRNRLVFTDDSATTLHLAASGATPPGAGDVCRIADASGMGPQAVLAELASRGLTRVLVEGGGVTVSRFLEAGCLDRLHVTVAPVIVGSGRPAFTLAPVERMDQAIRPVARRFELGEDILFDLVLRR